MISAITDRIVPAIIISVLLLIGYVLILSDHSIQVWLNTGLLFTQGILLNFLCSRYKIIGLKTNLILVVFSILSVLIIPELSFGDVIYGIVWLSGFFLAFESNVNPKENNNYLIYLGVLLGISQTINNISVLLFIPLFLLFIQTGTRNPRGFVLSLLYFLLIVFTYCCILFVIELQEKIPELVPNLTFDYSSFDNILIKLVLPFVILSILIHLAFLNSYQFRFPNRSKIFNITMLTQLIVAMLLILITAEIDLLIYGIMASSILLSFGFVYKKKSIFVNAAFASLMCIALASIYLYSILIL